jgi:hypothetical protein
MPWKECSVMDERLQFVARRLAGEQMADLCREFGISRKTGFMVGLGGLEPPTSPLSHRKSTFAIYSPTASGPWFLQNKLAISRCGKRQRLRLLGGVSGSG